MKTEAELLREQNIKDREAFLASFLEDPEFAEAMDAINSAYKEKSSKKRDYVNKVKPKRRSVKDGSFRFLGRIPSEQRKSNRLLNVAPVYTENDLVDETYTETYTRQRKTFGGFHNNSDLDDLEEIVYVPKTKHKNVNRGRTKRLIIPVEEVTEIMLNNVIKNVSGKKYSDSGTSCHQCRQKTLDQKTCCRNAECFGVRGQFCGVCLENRYTRFFCILSHIRCKSQM